MSSDAKKGDKFEGQIYPTCKPSERLDSNVLYQSFSRNRREPWVDFQ